MRQKLPLTLSLALSLLVVAIPAATQPLSGQERLELQICRVAAKQDATQCAASNADDPSRPAYEKYLADYYRQEIDLKALNNQVVAWQIFAANMIFSALVSFVAVAGVAMAAYQLYISAKLPGGAGETALETGSRQTSAANWNDRRGHSGPVRCPAAYVHEQRLRSPHRRQCGGKGGRRRQADVVESTLALPLPIDLGWRLHQVTPYSNRAGPPKVWPNTSEGENDKIKYRT